MFYTLPTDATFFAVLLMLSWVAFLMNLLAQTASDYFSPTLSSICDKLQLPYDIAGVTFLALGNGAPDFFSLIASFSGGADVLVGVGALLGGSMFVCTVVVGSIALLCPCDVSQKLFLRDISFHLTAVLMVVLVASIGDVHVGLAVSLLVTYFVYVCVVMATSFCSPKDSLDPMEGPTEGDIGLQVISSDVLQTAFWHPNSTSVPSPAPSANEPYTFSILDQEDEDGAINLTGGFAPQFDNIIQEDYYALPEVTTALQGARSASDVESNLERPLLSSKPKSVPGEVLSALYWQQWALRRRALARHAFSDPQWSSYPLYYRIYYILFELPFTLARDLTIPTIEEKNWNKLYAMAHPIASSLMLVFLFDLLPAKHLASRLPVFIIATLGSSFIIFLFTQNNRPPSSMLFLCLWTFGAFAMCVIWVYMVAGELITALSLLGVVMKLPPAFLGLTILAWGNSVGDFFTNTAVAKQGFGAMALAGCYAGPVFNLLVGFGTALVYASSQVYPKSYPVHLDASSKLSLAFLIISLSSSIVLVCYKGFKLDRVVGIYLLSLYCLYSAAQALLLLLQKV